MIAVIVTIFTFIFTHRFFHPKKAEIRDVIKIDNFFHLIRYHDLDGDMVSEGVVVTDYQGNPKAPYLYVTKDDIKRNDKILSWTNFNGQWVGSVDPFIVGDYDSDSKKEIYAFIYRNDSLFLNVIAPFGQKQLIRSDRFITIVKRHRGNMDLQVFEAGMQDLNNDGLGELVFVINVGYPKEPRCVFAYDVRNDNLKRSPRSGNLLFLPLFFDLNSDGRDEIIISQSFAPDNIDYEIPYPDSSTWAMVFDQNLDFLFEPIEYKYNMSFISMKPYSNSGGAYLVLSYNHRGKYDLPSRIELIDVNGRIARQFEIPESWGFDYILTTLPGHDNMLYLVDQKGNVQKFTKDLEPIDRWNLGIEGIDINGNQLFQYDCDQDGRDELVIYNSSSMFIIEDDFKTVTTLDFPQKNEGYYRASTKYDKTGEPLIYLQGSREGYFIQYGRNPWYPWKFPVYALTFIFGAFIAYLGFGVFEHLKKKAPELPPIKGSASDDTFTLKLGKQTRRFTRSDIFYIEADGAYTQINYGQGMQPTTIAHNIGKLEEMLPEHIFTRISRQHVINCYYLIAINKSKGTCELRRGSQVVCLRVSRTKLGILEEVLEST